MDGRTNGVGSQINVRQEDKVVVAETRSGTEGAHGLCDWSGREESPPPPSERHAKNAGGEELSRTV